MTLCVALDFDGVMYPFTRAWSVWWASVGGSPMFDVEPDVREFWLASGVSSPEFHDHLAVFAVEEGYRTQEPYPEALVGLMALFDSGCDLVGVSSRPASRAVVCSTYGWVADWMLPLRSVSLGPTSKLEVECDLLIDDDPAALLALEDYGDGSGILLDRPWNRESDLPRASWAELPALVAALVEAVGSAPEGERKWELAEALAEMV